MKRDHFNVSLPPTQHFSRKLGYVYVNHVVSVRGDVHLSIKPPRMPQTDNSFQILTKDANRSRMFLVRNDSTDICASV